MFLILNNYGNGKWLKIIINGLLYDGIINQKHVQI